MTLYVVTKNGVHVTQIAGIYNSESFAITEAKRLKAGECDNWHSYSVIPYELNKTVNQSPVIKNINGDKNGGDLYEPESIWWSNKK